MESALLPCAAAPPLLSFRNDFSSFRAPTSIRWPGSHLRPSVRRHLTIRHAPPLARRIVVGSLGDETDSERKDPVSSSSSSSSSSSEDGEEGLGDGGDEVLAEELETLEEEAMAGEDEGRAPTDYDRRANIFYESSRVFRALKDRTEDREGTGRERNPDVV